VIKIRSQNIMMQKEAFAALWPLVRASLPYLARGATELTKAYVVEKMIRFMTNLVKKKGADMVAKAMLRSTSNGKDASKLLSAYVSGGGKTTPEIKRLMSAFNNLGGVPETPKKSLWSLTGGSAGSGSGGGSSGSNARWNPSPELRLASAASTSSASWIQAAKAEGIPDDVITKIESLPLKNKLFFSRVMKNEEIPLDHFDAQAAAVEERIEQLKVGLVPKKVDDYKSLEEISADMDGVEEKYKKRMGGLEHKVFDPGDQMEVVRRFALPGFPAMTVYRYNNWEKQHHLIENSDRFCIGTMKNFDCAHMLHSRYGGEVFMFVRDGKQWALMAPHSIDAGSFTNMSNVPLTPCERAICIIAVYDLADKWKGTLAKSMSECSSEGFSEAYSYLSALPKDQEKEIKKDLMSRGMFSLHLTLLLETQSGRIQATESNKEIIEEAKQLISEGKFQWAVALKPVVYEVASENGASVAIDALKLAINSVRQAAVQNFKRALFQGINIPKHTEPQTQQQKQFLVDTFAPWEDLKRTLESPEWRPQIIMAASKAPYAKFISFLTAVASYDKTMLQDYNIDTALEKLSNDLKELMPYVIAHEKNQQGKNALDYVFGTGNPHAIQTVYERQFRGGNLHRQTQGQGLRWAQMEAHIVDMVLSGSDLSGIRKMLVPYLHAVEKPEDRLALMAQVIKDSAPEKAEDMIQILERAAGKKVRS